MHPGYYSLCFSVGIQQFWLLAPTPEPQPNKIPNTIITNNKHSRDPKFNESYNFYLLPKHKSWEYNDNMAFWSYHICYWGQVGEEEVVKGARFVKELLLLPLRAVGYTD